MQMKAFADKFESTLAASLPSLSLHHADVPLGLLGDNDKQALAHQRAVRTAMKRDQDDLRSSVDKPAEGAGELVVCWYNITWDNGRVEGKKKENMTHPRGTCLLGQVMLCKLRFGIGFGFVR